MKKLSEGELTELKKHWTTTLASVQDKLELFKKDAPQEYNDFTNMMQQLLKTVGDNITDLLSTIDTLKEEVDRLAGKIVCQQDDYYNYRAVAKELQTENERLKGEAEKLLTGRVAELMAEREDVISNLQALLKEKDEEIEREKNRWGTPCDKHEIIRFWLFRRAEDDKCFGCWIEGREKDKDEKIARLKSVFDQVGKSNAHWLKSFKAEQKEKIALKQKVEGLERDAIQCIHPAEREVVDLQAKLKEYQEAVKPFIEWYKLAYDWPGSDTVEMDFYNADAHDRRVLSVVYLRRLAAVRKEG